MKIININVTFRGGGITYDFSEFRFRDRLRIA